MAIFNYKAETSNGKTKRGTIVGLSENEVILKLKQKDLNVVSMTETTNDFLTKFSKFLNPISAKDLVIFSRQFSVMISANVPVEESLLILIDQTDNISLRDLISDIAFEVDGGAFLSDAFAKRPKIFSDFFVNIVRSGESSGKLDEVLNYLADEMEKNYDMSGKIKGAMIYPVFIIVLLIKIILLIVINIYYLI